MGPEGNLTKWITSYVTDDVAHMRNHKVRIFTEYHSVHMSPRRNWETTTPSFSPASVPLPPEPKEGGHTRLRVRGRGSPNSDDWRKSLALCLLGVRNHRLRYIRVDVKALVILPLSKDWMNEPYASNFLPCAPSCAGIFKQSMGARNRVGIGLSYRPARLHTVWQNWFL